MKKTYGWTAATGALMITLAAGPATSPLAAPASPGDGAPTPRACAAFGYGAQVSDQSEAVAVTGARVVPQRRLVQPRLAAPMGVAPPPALSLPAPPAAPPPPPPVSAAPSNQAYAKAQTPVGPTFPGHERYPQATPNPVKRVAEEPVSTFSIDVDTAAYANVRRFLNEGRRRRATRCGSRRWSTTSTTTTRGRAAATSRSGRSWRWPPRPGRRASRSSTSACRVTTLPAAERPPLNLVFLVDVSGSMWTEDRLPLAKKALNLLIDQLRPQDQVSMVVYAGAAGRGAAAHHGRRKAEDALRPGRPARRRLDGRRRGPGAGLRAGRAELHPEARSTG